MQPIFAIPPLTEEGVQKLVGQRCKVPVLSNPRKNWWVEIKEVRWTPAAKVICRVVADHHRFGRERWVILGDCRWRNHIDDPLLQAVAKARGERKLCMLGS
jgi:hypothetical protein